MNEAHVRLLVTTHLAVDQHKLYTVQELVGIVWLEYEIVRAAFQALDDVARLLQCGQEDDRGVPARGIGLDPPAQVIAGQPRHDDVAEDQAEA